MEQMLSFFQQRHNIVAFLYWTNLTMSFDNPFCIYRSKIQFRTTHSTFNHIQCHTKRQLSHDLIWTVSVWCMVHDFWKIASRKQNINVFSIYQLVIVRCKHDRMACLILHFLNCHEWTEFNAIFIFGFEWIRILRSLYFAFSHTNSLSTCKRTHSHFHSHSLSVCLCYAAEVFQNCI